VGTVAAPPRRLPTRSCVACRTSRPKRELIRVVRGTDRRITIDPTGRQNGRGAYLCRAGDCIDTGFGRGLLSKALGVPIPPQLASELRALTLDEGGARGEE
jgi:uncharacterized protein